MLNFNIIVTGLVDSGWNMVKFIPNDGSDGGMAVRNFRDQRVQKPMFLHTEAVFAQQNGKKMSQIFGFFVESYELCISQKKNYYTNSQTASLIYYIYVMTLHRRK